MTDPHARQKRYRKRIKAKADSAKIMEAALREIVRLCDYASDGGDIARNALAIVNQHRNSEDNGDKQ